MDPITVTNVISKTSVELAAFLNASIYVTKLPVITPNTRPSIERDIAPLLSTYANYAAYTRELYGVVYSAHATMKTMKKGKNPTFSEQGYIDLEAKIEILYRAAQQMEMNYEAASRLMTALGMPDNRSARHV